MEYRNTCNSDNSRLSIGAQVHRTASYLNALKKSFFCSVDKVPKKCITILLPCCRQGWDKYCPAGKFQWKMPDNAGMANTPKITEVANTGTYEQN